MSSVTPKINGLAVPAAPCRARLDQPAQLRHPVWTIAVLVLDGGASRARPAIRCGRGAPLRTRSSGWYDLADPLREARRVPRSGGPAAEPRTTCRFHSPASVSGSRGPDAESGGAGGDLQAQREFARLALALDLIGQIQRHAEKGQRRAVRAALRRRGASARGASCRRCAGSAPACGGPVGDEGAGARPAPRARSSGWMKERTSSIDRRRPAAPAHAQHRCRHGRCSVTAVGEQVVAPDAVDVGEFYRQPELRAGVAQRIAPGRRFRAVVHHHADDALGAPVSTLDLTSHCEWMRRIVPSGRITR